MPRDMQSTQMSSVPLGPEVNTDELSATSSLTVEHFRFLDLPAELRLLVYKHHLAVSAYEVTSNHIHLTSSSLVPVCRAVAAEYAPPYRKSIDSGPHNWDIFATVTDFDFGTLQSLLKHLKRRAHRTRSLSPAPEPGTARGPRLALHMNMSFSRFSRTDLMKGIEDLRCDRLSSWVSDCQLEWTADSVVYGIQFQRREPGARKSCFRCLISSLYANILETSSRYRSMARLKIRSDFERAAVALIGEESGLGAVPYWLEESPMLLLEHLYTETDKWRWKCGVCDLQADSWVFATWASKGPDGPGRGWKARHGQDWSEWRRDHPNQLLA